MIKLVCWNIAKNPDSWRCLVKNKIRADIALLQEATMPPKDVADRLNETDCLNVVAKQFQEVNAQQSQCMIVKLTDKADVKRLKPKPLTCAQDGDLKTTHPGCLAAAIITRRDKSHDDEPFYAVSFCPEYEKSHCSTGKMSWDIVDASVHRVISDLSLLVGKQQGHRIIAAGDLTIYHGYGEDKSGYWEGRYDTVFDRMRALGLPFVGPQLPCGGRPADPRPPELPKDSKNVPTYCKSFRRNPAAAFHQLDYVFASEGLRDSVKVRALNHPKEWGPSDHCRIEIEVP